jgi:hypothetical protein
MGREVYWIDQSTTTSLDFSDTLFITDHQVCQHIPKRDDCFYIIDNRNGTPGGDLMKPYRTLHYGRFCHKFYNDHGPITMLDPFMPLYPDKTVLEMIWATDLMPEEVLANKSVATVFNHGSREINWVGSRRGTLEPFRRACKNAGYKFNVYGNGVPIEDNIRLIQQSMFAPTIADQYQVDVVDYVPCRIFKNISYGHFGITNSPGARKVFGGSILFESDLEKLFTRGMTELPRIDISEQHELMDYVARHHTYVDRLPKMFEAARIVDA